MNDMKSKMILMVIAMITLASCEELSSGGAAPGGVKDVFRSMYPNAWAVEWDSGRIQGRPV